MKTLLILIILSLNFSRAKAGGFGEISLWNNYTLFTTPVLVDDSPSLQSLYIHNMDHGWSIMCWGAIDLDGKSGNEVDFNIRKNWSFGTYSLQAAIGLWNISDVEEIDGDIGIQSLTLSHKIVYRGIGITPSLLARYHYDVGGDRLGDGFSFVGKIECEKSFRKTTLKISPFVCYDRFLGFGWTGGYTAEADHKLTSTGSVFAGIRAIFSDEESGTTFGVGIRKSF